MGFYDLRSIFEYNSINGETFSIENNSEYSLSNNNVAVKITPLILPTKQVEKELKIMQDKTDKEERAIFSASKNYGARVENIDPHNIYQAPMEWCLFPYLTPDEATALKASIYEYGVLQNLVVVRRSDSYYYSLSGLERAFAVTELWDDTEDERFRTVPCIVIEESDINPYIAQNIMIDCNINRKRNRITNIKMILAKRAVLEKLKVRRKELNIADEIALLFGMDPSSVFNYFILDNAIKSVMHLVEIGQITLATARKLSSYSKEVQLAFVGKIGLENIHDYMFKNMPTYTVDLSDVDHHIENFKSRRQPLYGKLIISGPQEFIEATATHLKDFARESNFFNFKVKRRDEFFNNYVGFPELDTYHVNLPNFEIKQKEPFYKKKKVKKNVIREERSLSSGEKIGEEKPSIFDGVDFSKVNFQVVDSAELAEIAGLTGSGETEHFTYSTIDFSDLNFTL